MKKGESIKYRIISAAEKLFLKNGYSNTNTREVADEANIAAGTLFNYFPTKIDLFISIAKIYFKKMIKSLDKEIEKRDKENGVEVFIESLYRKLSERILIGDDFMKVHFEMESSRNTDIRQDFIEHIMKLLMEVFSKSLINEYKIEIDEKNEGDILRHLITIFASITIFARNMSSEHDENIRYLKKSTVSFIENSLLK
jgi:AcrR family transcriptional regulator